ncbi:retron St85 family effector protein [Bradyrhizobium liaoningense]|uniref:retron St85 family effector protein n=1 Tax=Bradyrhizobium liaoningense TaxID=43992 RepID=UPI001BA74883|nr:retron St85 family effector protein [Bradyrhizobium liaoningense]MBR0846097.1 retron St85 family effector protein [Bradyrhizobium liaoningense]
MDPESLRVHAPSSIVFLCGGVISPALPTPVMLRDAFLRIARLTAPPYTVILAEDAKPLVADAGYDNLLLFESDIAQVVGQILLFVESPGSLAELGAFAALDTVSPRLLVVLDEHYYNQQSFVKQGPLQYLEIQQGEESIVALDRASVGIDANGGIAGLNTANFSAAVLPALEKRLSKLPKHEKFSAANAGHAILLLVGLCQEFGAMTQSELREYLKLFGVKDLRFNNFVYCAELLQWIRKVRKGNNIYYVARGGESALEYQLNKSLPLRDKLRWRSDIRSHWQKQDAARFNAIRDVTTGGVAP